MTPNAPAWQRKCQFCPPSLPLVPFSCHQICRGAHSGSGPLCLFVKSRPDQLNTVWPFRWTVFVWWSVGLYKTFHSAWSAKPLWSNNTLSLVFTLTEYSVGSNNGTRSTPGTQSYCFQSRNETEDLFFHLFFHIPSVHWKIEYDIFIKITNDKNHMHQWIVHNDINNMDLENRVNSSMNQFHVNFGLVFMFLLLSVWCVCKSPY